MLQDVAKQFLTLFTMKVRHFNLQTNSKLAHDLPTLLQLFSSQSNVCYPDHHPYTEIKKEILHHLRILQRKHHVENCDRQQKSINLAKIHYTKLQTIRVDDVFTCVFQSQLLEFRVLEVTSSASIRLLQTSSTSTPRSCVSSGILSPSSSSSGILSPSSSSSGILSPSRPSSGILSPSSSSSGILSNPNGFIVRVSQKGLYKLRIDKIQVEFVHSLSPSRHLAGSLSPSRHLAGSLSPSRHLAGSLSESYQAWLWIMKSHPLFSYEALRLPTNTTLETTIKKNK